MESRLTDAVDHLMTYGYCVLENLLPESLTRSMADDFLRLHEDPDYDKYKVDARPYETMFGMMNYDDRTWQCAFHPDTVAVASHILGRCRVVEACSKPNWPGYKGQWPLHTDSAGDFHKVPDVPWMINSIWMLTDFTGDNGATRVVPLSHRSRLHRPPADLQPDDLTVKDITASAGSVVMWHAGIFHGAGPNVGDDIRVGLNIAYYPRWMNNWTEHGHQPLWPETHERMPPEYRALCVQKLGRCRDDAYETVTP